MVHLHRRTDGRRSAGRCSLSRSDGAQSLLTSAVGRRPVADLHRPQRVGQLVDRPGQVPPVGAERQAEHLGGGLLGGGGAHEGAVQHRAQRLALRLARPRRSIAATMLGAQLGGVGAEHACRRAGCWRAGRAGAGAQRRPHRVPEAARSSGGGRSSAAGGGPVPPSARARSSGRARRRPESAASRCRTRRGGSPPAVDLDQPGGNRGSRRTAPSTRRR